MAVIRLTEIPSNSGQKTDQPQQPYILTAASKLASVDEKARLETAATSITDLLSSAAGRQIKELSPLAPGNDKGITALKVSHGASLMQLRVGEKELVENSKKFQLDPLVREVQKYLRLREIRDDRGETLNPDGKFGRSTAEAVSKLRISLGLSSGRSIDKELVNRIFPELSIANLELGLISVSQANANTESSKIISETQRLLNSRFPNDKTSVNGQFSDSLKTKLIQFQRSNSIEPSGTIDVTTIKLLQGKSLESLIEHGEASLMVGTPGQTPSLEVVTNLQEKLNLLLDNNKKTDGKFGKDTARDLEIVQRALELQESRVYSSESHTAINCLASDPSSLKNFRQQIAVIETAQKVFSTLAPEDSCSLAHKMTFEYSLPETGLLDNLKSLNINIGTADGIKEFQKNRNIPESGYLDKDTAKHIYEVVSAKWSEQRVKANVGYEWRNGVDKVNVIGMRGWSPESGQNKNEFNHWNDTIALAWRDKEGLIRFREFPATTEPGIKHFSEAPDVNKDGCRDVGHMCEGQYRYKHGYYKGQSGAGVSVGGGEVKVYRDVNHDGKINQKDGVKEIDVKSNFFTRIRDWAKSYSADDSFKFHWTNSRGHIDSLQRVNGFSAGCQVPKIGKKEFQEKISPLLKANEGDFLYTLIDMSTGHLSPKIEAARFKHEQSKSKDLASNP